VKQTGLVYRKEMLDIRRERRTLFSMLVVPLLAMPAFIFGMGELMMRTYHESQNKPIYSVRVTLGEIEKP
jgi:ABC-type Na+ efflux pump permease subunit